MTGIRIGKTVVERRLTLEEILLVVFGTWGISLDIAATGTGCGVGLLLAGCYLPLFGFRDVVEPDEVVAIATVRVFLGRCLEPLTLAAGMSCHQVETHLDAALVGLIDQCHQVGIGAETGIYFIEVFHIVAAVKPSRLEDGVEPEGIHT